MIMLYYRGLYKRGPTGTFSHREVATREDIDEMIEHNLNSQNVLQTVAASNMIGLLEQMNKICIFAVEIFKDILKTTQSNNKRIKSAKRRISSIIPQMESVECMLLTRAPSNFYDNPYHGQEWQYIQQINSK